MKKILSVFIISCIVLVVLSMYAYSHCGHRGCMRVVMGRFQKAKDSCAVTDTSGTCAVREDGAREITYAQFMQLRNSGKKYIVIDVLSSESYNNGHIKGAVSFPAGEINKETAARKLSKNAKIVTYCSSFKCTASTAAAKKLSALGYNAVDYKGGLKEWQEKGNVLAK